MASGRCPKWSTWMLPMLLALGCRAGASGTAGPAQAYVIELEGGVRGSRGQEAWAQDVLADGLDQTRWLRSDGSGPRLSAQVRYEERELEPGVPVLRVLLSVEPDPELTVALDAVDEELEAHVELERRDHTVDLRRDLPFAVHRALAIIDAKITVAQGDVHDLEALLASDDPEVVIVALGGIRRRNERALGDAVFGLVEHEDERVALQAVECLGAIGGPEHAPGLLRGARLADRAHANRLYDALANLGGEHARGFLEFAARNEEDPELASLAERALTRLDAEQPSAVPSKQAATVARGHRQ